MDDIKTVARSYWEHAFIKCNAYYAAGRWAERWNTTLGVLATIASTLAGATALKEILAPANAEPFIALAALTAALLTGVQSAMKLGQRAEAFHKAAAGFEGLHHRLDIFLLRLGGGAVGREPTLREFGRVVQRFNQLTAGSPVLANWIYDRARARSQRAAEAHLSRSFGKPAAEVPAANP